MIYHNTHLLIISTPAKGPHPRRDPDCVHNSFFSRRRSTHLPLVFCSHLQLVIGTDLLTWGAGAGLIGTDSLTWAAGATVRCVGSIVAVNERLDLGFDGVEADVGILKSGVQQVEALFELLMGRATGVHELRQEIDVRVEVRDEITHFVGTFGQLHVIRQQVMAFRTEVNEYFATLFVPMIVEEVNEDCSLEIIVRDGKWNVHVRRDPRKQIMCV